MRNKRSGGIYIYMVILVSITSLRMIQGVQEGLNWSSVHFSQMRDVTLVRKAVLAITNAA